MIIVVIINKNMRKAIMLITHASCSNAELKVTSVSRKAKLSRFISHRNGFGRSQTLFVSI